MDGAPRRSVRPSPGRTCLDDGGNFDQHRLHVGDLATLTDQVFTAWQADRAAGLDAIMLAPTRELVADLNGPRPHTPPEQHSN
jgi:hypothetical protein